MYDEHVELTQDTLLTHFMFTIPGDAPAMFATQLVALRWVLRFELAAMWVGGGGRRKPPETLSWVLPVAVFPPSPGSRR